MKLLVITFALGDDELTDEYVESLRDEADRDEAIDDLLGKGEYAFTVDTVEVDELDPKVQACPHPKDLFAPRCAVITCLNYAGRHQR